MWSATGGAGNWRVGRSNLATEIYVAIHTGIIVPPLELVIRGGLVADGSARAEPFVADIGVAGDRIVAVGRIKERGQREMDARGMLVTPGFVDIHTHYDGQAIWESRMSPSSQHGVTTAVIGNCGVGFAPCRPQDRARLVTLMEGIEDIPGIVMTEGLTWQWESYPQYLDALEARAHDIDLASYLPHSPLRVHVMRERAFAGETASAEDIALMAETAREAMAAGAIGFSTSRSLFHRGSDGGVVPTLDAGATELLAIAKVVGASNGILQVAADLQGGKDPTDEFDLLMKVARGSGCALTLPLAQLHHLPDAWRPIVAFIDEANRQGVTTTGQVLPRAIGMMLGLDLSLHPFCFSPPYLAIRHLPLAARITRMRDPILRTQIIANMGSTGNPLHSLVQQFDRMFEMAERIDYEPTLESSVGARAAREGILAIDLAYDLLLERDGKSIFFMPAANYVSGNLDLAHDLFRHPHMVLGLGDGGAHYGSICDASYTTFLLSHWTRDRSRGKKLSIAEVVHAMTHETAMTVGLQDRGLLAVGYKADINVIDYDNLMLYAPRVSFDLPGGGKRLTQKADGFMATIVNGKVTYREGKPTGELPGRLVRGRKKRVERRASDCRSR